jgi:hypothetical protein
MSVYKCHAFIFLDQPPPWPSRTSMFSKKTSGSGNAQHGVGDADNTWLGRGGELPEDVHCISGGEYNTYCTIQYDKQYVLVHVASGGVSDESVKFEYFIKFEAIFWKAFGRMDLGLGRFIFIWMGWSESCQCTFKRWTMDHRTICMCAIVATWKSAYIRHLCWELAQATAIGTLKPNDRIWIKWNVIYFRGQLLV